MVLTCNSRFFLSFVDPVCRRFTELRSRPILARGLPIGDTASLSISMTAYGGDHPFPPKLHWPWIESLVPPQYPTLQASKHAEDLELPPKEVFKSARSTASSEVYVEKRRAGLHGYLTALVSLPHDPFMAVLFEFLGVMQFLKVRPLP